MNSEIKNFIENIYDGLYTVDRHRQITYWNKSAERITGFTAAEVTGSHCYEEILIHVDGEGNSLCRGMCPLAATIKDGTPREAEIYLHHKDGHRVPVWVRVSPQRNEYGEITGGIELFSDLSAREAMRLRVQELEKFAFLDNLTQLANRRYLDIELEARFAEKKRYGLTFGILMMDIDDFKKINDTYGHETGDAVLKITAKTMMDNARPFDIFGRWGGEEFIAIIRNVDISELIKIGERIRVLIEKSMVRIENHNLNVTVSMGATIAGSDTTKSIIKRADRLLYTSKEKGRNRLTSD